MFKPGGGYGLCLRLKKVTMIMWRLRPTLLLVPGLAASAIGAVLCTPKERSVHYCVLKYNGFTFLVRDNDEFFVEGKKYTISATNKNIRNCFRGFIEQRIKDNTFIGRDIRRQGSVRLDCQSKEKKSGIPLRMQDSNGCWGDQYGYHNYHFQIQKKSFSVTLLPLPIDNTPNVEEIKSGLILSAKQGKQVIVPNQQHLKDLGNRKTVIVDNRE